MKTNRFNKTDLIAKALLALSAIGLMGCQPEQASILMSSSALVTGSRSANSVMNSAVKSLPLIGVVYADASQQAAFQNTVAGLVSTDIPESSLGTVSAQLSDGTGVMLAGKVMLADGRSLSQLGGWTQVSIASNSMLRVDVAHSLESRVGRPTLPFTRATGYIQGTSVYLRFTDDLGYVQMNGQIVNQRFQGSFEFVNYVRYDGSRPGAAGTVGMFDVPACEFFRCY